MIGLDMNIVVSKLTNKLKQHHTLYSFPCKAELFEEIWASVLREISSNSEVLWEADGSHSSGADVIFRSERHQNKGGEINFKKGTLKWSGSRTTKYKTLQEKVEFISKDKYDFYIFLSREKKDWKTGKKIYYLGVVPANKIDYGSLNWKSSEKNPKNFIGISENLKANIQHSMSDQLWTEVELSSIEKFHRIVV